MIGSLMVFKLSFKCPVLAVPEQCVINWTVPLQRLEFVAAQRCMHPLQTHGLTVQLPVDILGAPRNQDLNLGAPCRTCGVATHELLHSLGISVAPIIFAPFFSYRGPGVFVYTVLCLKILNHQCEIICFL